MVLDNDGNGSISLDEFLNYFENLELSDQNEYEKQKAEEEYFQNIWPDWVIRDGKIDLAKNVVLRMFDSLKNTPNISAE